MAAEQASLTESLVRRDRAIVIAGLVALTLLAWAYLAAGAGMGMSIWEMTSATLFPHRTAMEMEPEAWSPMRWRIMFLMWWVMMIAMMTPSAAPMILLYARATRHAQAKGRSPRGVTPTAAFAGGYLIAWLGFSGTATALQWGLERLGAICGMMMSSTSAGLSAAILIFVGLYQLSPMKRHCLGSCSAPATFLSSHWRPGVAGAWRMGLDHGLFCVGCCWMLMALLFVGGVMNGLWIAILSVFVLLEKLAAFGPWLARITGIILIAWGAATLMI